MKGPPRLAVWLYRALLRLYPRRFRAEFAAEMEAVFAQAAAGLAGRGLLALCLRELRDLPGAALTAHLRELRLAGSLAAAYEDRPGTWAETAWAALPHLLVTAFVALPGLAAAGGPLGGAWQAALPLAGLGAIAAGLAAGWRKGWPRWSAGWLSYALIIAVVLAGDRLLNGFGGVGDPPQWNTLPYLGQQMLSEVALPCVLIALLYAITHRDLIMGLIAVLPLAHLAWIFQLEFVPPVPSALVRLAAWGVMGLAAAALVRRGTQAGGVWLAVAASALVGLLYCWGAVYLSAVGAFGPRTPASVWNHFAPDFLGSAALLLGLPLGRRLWEHARGHERLGRVAFGLALAGFIAMLAGMFAAYRLYLPDDLEAFRPALGPGAWITLLAGAQAYVAGAALIGFAAWPALNLRGRAAYVLLAALLFAAPWMHHLPRALATTLLPVATPVTGALVRLPAYVLHTTGMAAAAAWLALALVLAASPVPEEKTRQGLGVRG